MNDITRDYDTCVGPCELEQLRKQNAELRQHLARLLSATAEFAVSSHPEISGIWREANRHVVTTPSP